MARSRTAGSIAVTSPLVAHGGSSAPVVSTARAQPRAWSAVRVRPSEAPRPSHLDVGDVRLGQCPVEVRGALGHETERGHRSLLAVGQRALPTAGCGDRVGEDEHVDPATAEGGEGALDGGLQGEPVRDGGVRLLDGWRGDTRDDAEPLDEGGLGAGVEQVLARAVAAADLDVGHAALDRVGDQGAQALGALGRAVGTGRPLEVACRQDDARQAAGVRVGGRDPGSGPVDPRDEARHQAEPGAPDRIGVTVEEARDPHVVAQGVDGRPVGEDVARTPDRHEEQLAQRASQPRGHVLAVVGGRRLLRGIPQ